jgi:hypothetical protein
MNRFYIHSVGMALSVWLTGASSAAEELEVRIEPLNVQMRRFDPIILRITLHSHSTEPIYSGHEPTASAGVLKFELRKESEIEYRKVRSVSENLSWGARLNSTIQFVPRGKRTTGAIIMETTKIQAFDGPGIYELRAFLTDSDDFKGISDPIRIEVEETTAGHLRDAERASDIVVRETTGGLSRRATEKAFLEAIHLLEECELKRTGKLLAAMAAIRDANTGDGFVQARARLKELRIGLPEPTQDWISATMARTYLKIEQLDLSADELGKLPRASYEREMLDRLVRERKSLRVKGLE